MAPIGCSLRLTLQEEIQLDGKAWVKPHIRLMKAGLRQVHFEESPRLCLNGLMRGRVLGIISTKAKSFWTHCAFEKNPWCILWSLAK
jgi:hypothetical protein